MYRQWVPCERNSSYNFIPIFLKLCTCFLHGLKMWIWFGYNPCIYFCYFFHFANFVIFWPQILWKCCDSGYLVSATPHTILYWSFWNFVHVFAMVWRCAYGFDIILELIFVTFSTLWTLSFSDLRFYESLETYGFLVSATPHTILYRSLWNFAHVFAMVWRCARGLDIILELIFVTFSTLWTLSFLTSDSVKVYRQWLPCKRNSLYNFMPVFMQLCTSFFFHGLKMCIWFGFNPAVNFCHFSTLLTLSVFAGATSTSPKFDLFLFEPCHEKTCLLDFRPGKTQTGLLNYRA